MRDYRQRKRYAIFMKLNEWTIFIKESRDWRASKCRSIECDLIERRGDDDDDDDGDDGSDSDSGAISTAAVGFLRCLWDDLVRTLLASRISARRRVRGVTSDCAYYVEGVFIESSRSESNLWRNLSNVHRLYRLIWAICLMKVNLILRL